MKLGREPRQPSAAPPSAAAPSRSGRGDAWCSRSWLPSARRSTPGASPRAGLLLLRAAKAQAVLEGRGYVLPEDVQEMWAPSLRHRVVLDPALEVEGQTTP